MNRLPSAAELTRETRNWLERGVIPAEAARVRRVMAEQAPKLKAWHLAFAENWDKVAARNPKKVVEAYTRKLNYEIECIAYQVPGSPLAKYWQDRAAETDAILQRLDPEHTA